MTPEQALATLYWSSISSFVMDGQLYTVDQINEAARTLAVTSNIPDPTDDVIDKPHQQSHRPNT